MVIMLGWYMGCPFIMLGIVGVGSGVIIRDGDCWRGMVYGIWRVGALRFT
jgi:hypothetical protein